MPEHRFYTIITTLDRNQYPSIDFKKKRKKKKYMIANTRAWAKSVPKYRFYTVIARFEKKTCPLLCHFQLCLHKLYLHTSLRLLSPFSLFKCKNLRTLSLFRVRQLISNPSSPAKASQCFRSWKANISLKALRPIFSPPSDSQKIVQKSRFLF